MTEIVAPILSMAAVALVLVARWWYLRRIPQGRADPVIDPSWPTMVRPQPTELSGLPSRDKETSLYHDTRKSNEDEPPR
jgi:hypothetical protein